MNAILILVGTAIFWATGSPPKTGILLESQFWPFDTISETFYIIILVFELYVNET